MNIKDLVKSIAANPSAHVVDREKKMNETIDVMCKNIEAHHRNQGGTRVLSELEINRGYGEGRNTGD